MLNPFPRKRRKTVLLSFDECTTNVKPLVSFLSGKRMDIFKRVVVTFGCNYLSLGRGSPRRPEHTPSNKKKFVYGYFLFIVWIIRYDPKCRAIWRALSKCSGICVFFCLKSERYGRNCASLLKSVPFIYSIVYLIKVTSRDVHVWDNGTNKKQVLWQKRKKNDPVKNGQIGAAALRNSPQMVSRAYVWTTKMNTLAKIFIL